MPNPSAFLRIDRTGRRRALVPLSLTLVRLPLAALVWLVAQWPWALVAVMFVAGLSDVLDGWTARRLGVANTRRSGAWLDPLCDKVFVVSTLFAVLVFYQPPWWWVPLVAARECVQLPLTALYHAAPGLRRGRRYDFRAERLGKAASVAQFVAIVALIYETLWLPAAIIAGVIGLAAAGCYVMRAVVQLPASASKS